MRLRNTPVFAMLLAVLLIGWVASGCGNSDTVHVSISGNRFDPATVTVPVGTTVVWSNSGGGTPHSVLSDKFGQTMPKKVGPNEIASGPIAPGASFTEKFTAPGTYRYHCMIHPYMHAAVIVK